MKHKVVKTNNNEILYYKDALMLDNVTFYTLTGIELSAKKGDKIEHHFAIKHDSKESDIHKEAKAAIEWLVNNQITINIKCRKYEIDTLSASYATQECYIPYTGNKADVMLYNADGSINCIIEIFNTNKTKENKRAGYTWYELDASKVMEELVNYIKYGGDSITFHCIRPYPIVFINQLGAGNGKTYMSVKLIEDNKRFENIETFIYVTKVHSAKYAISDKFKEIFGEDESYMPNISPDGKKIYYEPGKKIIICTIDYLYNCLTKEIRANEDDGTHYISNNSIFEKAAEELSCNPLISKILPYWSKTLDGNIKESSDTIELNDKTLLIIDEAQDLNLKYTKAYFNITRHCNMICYAIGDSLQSLTCKDSIYQDINIISKLEEECGVYCQYLSPPNICRRFKHKDHMILVNDIVNTNIVGISETGLYEPKGGLKAVNIIRTNITSKRSNNTIDSDDDDDDDDKYNSDINVDYDTNIMDAPFYNDIIKKVELEVDVNIYTPRNFMFILPIMTGVEILEPLSARLREFWQRKLLDETYRAALAAKGEEYWLNIKDSDKEKYSFIHKSEAGRPIDLDESINQTRFLSIDASKGNGCEVVFVLNFTHKNIRSRADCIMEINYTSFVHVALTRQKNSIYVYLNSRDDLLSDRFSNYNKELVLSANRYNKESNRITFQPDRFNIKDFYYSSIKVDSIFTRNKSNPLIDMNYHILRNYAMKTIMHIRCITNCKDIDKDADFARIIKNININKIIGVSPREYFTWLNLSSDNETYVKIMENSKKIPLLTMILPIAKVAVTKLQRKIQFGTYEKFCPLEYVMISFVWNIIKFRKYSEFTCTDLYNIMAYYTDIATSNHISEYECGCPGGIDNLECQNKIVNFISEIDSVANIIAKVPSHKFEMSNKLFYKYDTKKYVVANPMFVSYKICDFDPLSPYKKEYTIYIIQPVLDLNTLPQALIKAEVSRFMLKNCSNNELKCIKDITIKIVTTSFKELIDVDIYKHCRLDDTCIKKAIDKYINSR